MPRHFSKFFSMPWAPIGLARERSRRCRRFPVRQLPERFLLGALLFLGQLALSSAD